MRGYSFLEICFVLLLLIILSTLAYPNLRFFFYQTEDEILKNEILEMIHLAQLQADIAHVGVGICATTDGIKCLVSNEDFQKKQLIFYDDYQDGFIHDPSQIINKKYVTLTNGSIKWRAYPHYRQTLLFHPLEDFNSDNSAIWHCHQQKLIWAILVSHTGRPHVVGGDKLPEDLTCESPYDA